MPSVALAVGTAVAKAVVKFWLRDRELAQNVSLSLADVLAAKLPGELERRRATRSFDRLAEDVADRLAPFIETELRGLTDNERSAAALTVADALNATRISAEILFSIDLNPLLWSSWFGTRLQS